MGRITGIGRFVRDLASHLKETEIRPLILSPSDTRTGGVFRPSGIDLRWKAFRSLELAFKTAARMMSLRRQFDVVHAQQPHLQSLVASLVARVLGKPSVLTLHLRVPRASSRTLRLMHSGIDRLALAYANVAVAVSPLVAEEFRHREMRVIENGVDTRLFRPSEENRQTIRSELGIKDCIVFVFAGRWARSKGFDLLLQAAHSDRLAGRPFHLLILGERAPEEPHLISSVAPNPENHGRIRVLGAVDDLPMYLNAGDVFILPSRLEGLPLAFLEAMASGLPVIASDIAIHRRIAEQSGCVRTFRTGDHEDLARVMDEVIRDGIPGEWPKRARDTVLRRYDLNRMARSYVHLYRELVARRPGFA
jgi:glycosyltransferase involved in cell wall biosynthesis